MEADPAPLVLTLAIDADTQQWLQRLRDAHFPPALNRVPAHVTLFHALPGAWLGTIATELRLAAAELAPGPVRIGPAFSLGRGVALRVDPGGVAALRARLAAGWAHGLTAQDRQGWRPHATVQNKVSPELARRTLAELLGVERQGTAIGLDLWHYRGGPWAPITRVSLGG